MLPVHVVHKGDPREKQIRADIVHFVKHGGCRNQLHAEYVGILLDGADVVLYQKYADNIVSFLIADWEGSKMVTSAVCSDSVHGSAKDLILASFKIARARGKTTAELHSVNRALAYYPRFGYARVDDPTGAGGWLHVKNLKRGKNWYAQRNMSPLMKHHIQGDLMKLQRTYGAMPYFPPWLTEMPHVSNSEGSNYDVYSPRRRSRSRSTSSHR